MNIYEMRLMKQKNLWAYQYTQGKFSWDAIDEKMKTKILQEKSDEIEQLKENEAVRLKTAAEFDAAKAMADRERAARDEEIRQIENEKLRQEFRYSFFAANKTASEADFARVYPAMRDAHFIEQTKRADELAYQKAKVNYQL